MIEPLEPPIQGLSSALARDRLLRDGPNDLPQARRRGWWATLCDVMREPMFILLLLGAAVYLSVGDRAEGMLLLGFSVLTVGLVVVQGHRRERALEALREMSIPLASVMRDGSWIRIPSSALVVGDCIAVCEGDRVAADGVLIRCSGLQIDESLLTGESWPVTKSVDPGNTEIWAGTMAVSGQGLAQVVATGTRTRMGQIGAALETIDLQPTPLQLQLQALMSRLGWMAAFVCLVILLWSGWVRDDWLGGALAALAVGMGLLPEEFPMALTVFMALGAWRLSTWKVLARRPAVIETLGAISVLSVDKTGTLTENRQQLWSVQDGVLGWRIQAEESPPLSLLPLMEVAWHATSQPLRDPLDRAIAEALGPALHSEGRPLPWQGFTQVTAQAVRTGAPYGVWIWEGPDRERRTVVKGAPEVVAALCKGGDSQGSDPSPAAASLAALGFRVLGLAQGPSIENLTWVGLLAFRDPIRPDVARAVDRARSAGIAVVMLTGDHAQTATAIATEAGIDVDHGALLGAQFEAMEPDERRNAAQQVRVYARVTPLQKLMLVRALQSAGHSVAMTGDGVNDAPALKAANVGIAMGRRGTDVAREASGLVLMDEGFGRIVQGIEHGRRLHDNLRRVSCYILAIHVPLAVLALIPMVMGWPAILLPAHVVLVEMIVDPVCALVFEAAPAASNVMRRAPRPTGEPLLAPRDFGRAFLLGSGLAACCLWLFYHQLGMEAASAGPARTAALLGLTAGNLCLVLVLSGWRGIPLRSMRDGETRLPWIAASVVTVLALALYWPPLTSILRLERPTFVQAALALAAGVSAVLLGQAVLQSLIRSAPADQSISTTPHTS